MRIFTLLLVVTFIIQSLYGQDPMPTPADLEVDGNARIMEMETIFDSKENVVVDSEGTLAVRSYKVGDLIQGGIVFYVDESGEHGLVCSLEELGPSRWYAGTNGVTRAQGSGLYAGEMNTAIIIAGQVAIGDDGADYAAHLCAEFQVAVGSVLYGDWYLPTTNELALIYNRIADIQEITIASGGDAFSDFYWSSEENTSDTAFGYDFMAGSPHPLSKSSSKPVRAVRAF